MLLSIIIPVYNTKDYLRKCVGSVLACDCSDCEILLIDDGSTDGASGALCDRLAEETPEIVRVIHQQNQGLGGARNTGIGEARGEYLFFIDSDDAIVPGALELLKKEIARTHADIISFDLLADHGSGTRQPVGANAFAAEQPFTLAERPEYMLSLPSACSRIWKKSLFVQSGIRFPERVWYEDIRTTVKLYALAEGIVSLKDGLYVYFSRGGSIMRSANVDRNREIIDAFEDLLGWYREKGLLEQYRPFLCRLCLEHLYLSASVRVLRCQHRHPLLQELADYMQQAFPDYRETDLSYLPGARRLVYRLLEKRRYALIALLFKLRK